MVGRIQLEVAGHHLDHPVERHAGNDWVHGPIGASVLHAPFEFQVHRSQGEMRFDVAIYWSTWSPDGPGWAAVKSGIAALAKDGWVPE
ncbi:TonB-dependent receptor [Streptomyces lydicamycinicus]|uniref:TonB-dependent receptor n=1 Tax=Streptomyces lydicamycinicus TaxID=1546107 RepID=A0A0N7YLG9_9ACTN|nr:TonB-dependent receptor [Streptomyces lydicamycinicus]